MRYRLRFLLQELDLPPGETIIGRSLECNLTIEDPLVSRRHARILIDDEGARVEDLKSRNGVRVNGVLVRGATRLQDGDRVRLGTQDLVFCRVGPAGAPHAKTTGVLRLCAKCRLPYPREVPACPHCEATEQTEEGTLTGDEEHGVSWTVQLLLDALERALALQRAADVERIARRAMARLEEHVAAGGEIDAPTLDAIALKFAALTLAHGDAAWLSWVLDVYRRTGVVPSGAAADAFVEAATRGPVSLRPALGAFVAHFRALRSTSSPADALDAADPLAQLETALDRAPSAIDEEVAPSPSCAASVASLQR